MDYEKKYKETIERARKLQENSNGMILKKWLWNIFPELQESEDEDEKIRKELIDIVAKSPITFAFEDKEKVLAWLEKQGTKEPKKTSIWNHWKDGICGNGEGKLIYLIKDGDDYSLSSCLAYECDYIELSALDELMLPKKQGEQRTACSEEDEKMMNSFLHKMEVCDLLSNKESVWITNKLKSLKPQPKVEWSEEDNYNLQCMIAKVSSDIQKGKNVGRNNELIDWLKSLKQRCTWKPSDEQMVVLELASKYERVFTPKQIDILIDLKEQLKKLKGE